MNICSRIWTTQKLAYADCKRPDYVEDFINLAVCTVTLFIWINCCSISCFFLDDTKQVAKSGGIIYGLGVGMSSGLWVLCCRGLHLSSLREVWNIYVPGLRLWEQYENARCCERNNLDSPMQFSVSLTPLILLVLGICSVISEKNWCNFYQFAACIHLIILPHFPPTPHPFHNSQSFSNTHSRGIKGGHALSSDFELPYFLEAALQSAYVTHLKRG